MKVFITGGTGFVGSTLTDNLLGQGYQVTVLTRKLTEESLPLEAPSFLEGNPTNKGAWQEAVSEHDVIINLAGAPIFTKWDKESKRAIRDSRVLTTENLVEALSHGKGKKTTLISASAVGYYGFQGDEDLNEDSPADDDFLASVSRQWEAAAVEAEAFGVRVVICRFGVVLGKNGGALGELIPIFQKGLGSPLGSGKQWFSWIHEMDLAGVCLFLIASENLSGPINCTAPEPVRNKELARVLAETMGRPTFMPAVPAFVVKMMKGEFGATLLEGQRVLPKRLLDAGFRFRFSTIKEALTDIFI